MDTPKMLQIPASIEDCIYLMRSYIYIDKFHGNVDIREITPCLAPAFILGVCAQIPFLYEFVQPYVQEVYQRTIYEVEISEQCQQEIARNDYLNSQMIYFEYTPTDCDFVLSILLNAIVHSMYGRTSQNFKQFLHESISNICEMANIYPMNVNLPRSFRHIMKSTLIAVPELRTRMMSLLCHNNYFQQGSIWSLVKRYIWIQIRNHHMGTFMAIGEWYEAREKTLAHVDPEIVDEMKRYEACMEQIKSFVDNDYALGAFRILNPRSMLPYLRQFPASAYCAIEWKKKSNPRWSKYNLDIDRFGVDTKQFDQLLSIPVKYTLKRKLNDEEIDQISNKRFKQLDTIYTSDDTS